MAPMELVGVRVEVPANTPMVLLREQTGAQRLLPIYIGGAGGDGDPLRPRRREPPRPLTHDLFVADAAPSSASTSSRSSSPRSATTRSSPSCTCSAPTGTTGRLQPAVRRRSPSPCGAAPRCSPPRSCSTRSARMPARRAGGRGGGDHRRVPRLHRTRQPRRLRLELTRASLATAPSRLTGLTPRGRCLRLSCSQPRNYTAVVSVGTSLVGAAAARRRHRRTWRVRWTRVQRHAGGEDRRHHVPAARLLGAHRPHPAVADRRHRAAAAGASTATATCSSCA